MKSKAAALRSNARASATRREANLSSHSKRSADYTRRDAIRDGQLIDLSRWAALPDVMEGAAVPIAITETAWKRIGPRAERGRQVRRRALRVLCAARSAVLEALPQLDRVRFRVRGDGTLVIEFHESDEEQLIGTIMVSQRHRS